MNLAKIKLPTQADIKNAQARKSQTDFMRATWMFDTQPFLVGFHTDIINKWLDEAVEKYRRGISSYAYISLPPRSGKSQIVSRSFVPRFLGEFPEGEVITTSYNTKTAQQFSKDAKAIMESEKYRQIYPNSRLDPDNKGVESWGLDNRIGKTLWSGIDGSITGFGANLAIADDILKGRAEANSETIRNKRWEAFAEGLMTRLAPVHIVLIVGTRWHPDDIIGRVEKEMKGSQDFPRFDTLVFPAKAEDYKGVGEYRGKYLFPERFSDEYYERQYASLGRFASSALLDCAPSPKSGNILQCEEGRNWKWVDDKPEGFGRLYRCWDLASTKKNADNDPDYTVGVLLAVRVEVMRIYNYQARKSDQFKTISIYIKDIVSLREDAVNRNNTMLMTVGNDGAGCVHFVESFGAQKDTAVILKKILGGSRIVKAVKPKGDKEFKITEALEAPLINGNVFIDKSVNRKVLDKVIEELKGFPFHVHDCHIDAISIGVNELSSKAYNAWWVNK